MTSLSGSPRRLLVAPSGRVAGEGRRWAGPLPRPRVRPLAQRLARRPAPEGPGVATARREVGVTLVLPEPFASQLQAWRERLGCPQADVVAPHVTLLPPTNLPVDLLPDVEAHLRAVAARHPAFSLRLGGSGTFRPVSPVVFVAVTQGRARCARLADDVRGGPLRRPLTFPFSPHVTIAHDLPVATLDEALDALADFEGGFTVGGLRLSERVEGGVWRALRDFAFGAPGGTGTRW